MTASILFLAVGSWGDVAPVLTVARALTQGGVTGRPAPPGTAGCDSIGPRPDTAGGAARGADRGATGSPGWRVRVAVTSDYVAAVEAAGFEAVDLGIRVEPLLRSPLARQWIVDFGGGLRSQIRGTRRMYHEFGREAGLALLAAWRPGEAVVSGLPAFPLGAALAEIQSVRHALLLFIPLSPSRSADATSDPVTPWPSPFNRWSTAVVRRFVERCQHGWTGAVRSSLGLAPWTQADFLAGLAATPTLYGVSRQFLPPPADWPDWVGVSGHLLGDDDSGLPPGPDGVTAVPPGLAEFLDQHRNAVFVGFGSFTATLPERDGDLVRAALALAGQPAVVASDTMVGPVRAATPLFAVGRLSYAWLFPRVVGAVHHASSGTAQRVTLSGLPSVSVPLLGDQPYWARRLARLGLGPEPIPYSRLTAARLATAIRALTDDPAYTGRARQLASAMAREQGPAEAAAFLARWVGQSRP